MSACLSSQFALTSLLHVFAEYRMLLLHLQHKNACEMNYSYQY